MRAAQRFKARAHLLQAVSAHFAQQFSGHHDRHLLAPKIVRARPSSPYAFDLALGVAERDELLQELGIAVLDVVDVDHHVVAHLESEIQLLDLLAGSGILCFLRIERRDLMTERGPVDRPDHRLLALDDGVEALADPAVVLPGLAGLALLAPSSPPAPESATYIVQGPDVARVADAVRQTVRAELGVSPRGAEASDAPVSTLFVKDRSLANNPIGALYSDYYLQEARRTAAGSRP